MRLELEPDRRHRIERGLLLAVVIAALATIPLTYAHMQQWDGWALVAADWGIWAVFAADLAFHTAISTDRRRTFREQWVNIVIVAVSFPLLPRLLDLTRLARLVRPLRLFGGLRIARPLHLVRLYLVRSVGGRRLWGEAKHTPPVARARERVDDAGGKMASHLKGDGARHEAATEHRGTTDPAVNAPRRSRRRARRRP